MMQTTTTLRVESSDPQHPQALRLLAEAALEARALYPELFARDAPAPGNGFSDGIPCSEPIWNTPGGT